MGPAEDLSGAEVVGASLVALLAVPIVTAYLLDRVGLSFPPVVVLSVTAASTVVTFLFLNRRAVWCRLDVALFCGIVVGILAWLLWLGRPSLFPPGHGPDLTHHLLLIGYIEQHWRLAHDLGTEAYLGEMFHYTPGVHVLAAMTGAWARTNGLHTVYPVVAAAVALKLGFVYLIAMRVLPPDVPRRTFAVASVVLLFLPREYFIGSFTSSSFFAQVLSELFAVVMWWALVTWDEQARPGAMLLFALAGAAAFLTWPVLTGPPAIALAVIVLARKRMSLANRFKHLLIGGGPILVVVGSYFAAHLPWLAMVSVSGSVLRPSPEKYGWWFLALSVVGLAIAATRRRGRATAILAAGVAIQIGALYRIADARGASTPYLALKMFYFAVYPQAVAAALTLAEAWQLIRRSVTPRVRAVLLTGRVADGLAWALLAVLAVRIGRGVPVTARAKTVVSEPVYRAGVWAREHVPAGCVEYLVGDPDTAYWLHLAVLGNPRMSARTGDDATYELGPAILRWLAPSGLRYAIADLTVVPRDVSQDLNIIASFGTAAVVERRGSASCPEVRSLQNR